jgi:serine phosphatase RsbU (regulator of sigma subunit)
MAERPPSSRSQTRSGPPRDPGLGTAVRERMAEDAAWRYFTGDGRWICPFCLNPVAKRAGAPIHDAAGGHLARCTAHAGGRGAQRSEAEIAHRVRIEQVGQVAAADPSWRIYDHEGIWWCPGCLSRVPSVRLGAAGDLTSFTTRALTEHAAVCAALGAGTVHTPAEVQAAAERGTWLISAERVVRSQIAFPSWRYAARSGAWICPCCLAAVPDVVIRKGAVEWETLIAGMTRHLALGCAAVRSLGRFEPRSEDDVRDAAVRAEPGAGTTVRMARPLGDGRNAGGMRTPLHSAALRRPPGTPTGSTGRDPFADEDVEPPAPTAPVAPVATTARRVRPGASPLPLSPELPVAPELPLVPESEPEARPGTDALPGWLRNGEPPVIPVAPAVSADAADAPMADDDDGAPGGDGGGLAWMDSAEEAMPKPATESLERTDVLRARDLQEELLQDVPTLDGWQFATRFEACAEVSGDFYQFMELRGGRIGFAIGDVSGHGVQAGLIMSMAKKTLEIFASLDLGPADTLAKVNAALAKDLGGKHFVSMCYGVLDPAAATITWARAGHPPPLLLRSSGALEEVKPRGMVVGMKSGPIFRDILAEETSGIMPGDLVLLYTDGITEAMNRTNEEFGDERLAEILHATAGLGPERLCTEIMDRVRGFRGGGAPSDDLTLVALAREA